MRTEEIVENLKKQLSCGLATCFLMDECENCEHYLTYEESCDGLKAAIEALQNIQTQGTCSTCKHEPPEIKWPCVDCDMREPADRWEEKTTDDLISRQAAIEAAIFAADEWDGGYNINREEKIKKTINNLPSVHSEPKPGRWIEKKDKHGYAFGECSYCGMSIYAGRTKHCPNCGVKMENAI